MPVSGFLALLDDIATVLDDVAILTKVAAQKATAVADDVALLSKVAAQKTAGVLGDDLALNAEQVTGVMAERELPVVWGVFKGSLVNKAILVPLALAISAVAPWAVTPLLMVGGLYLCFEGFEKVAHKLLHGNGEDEARHAELTDALLRKGLDLVAVEKEKIKGAVRTDFVLSAEIITIALGIVAKAPFATRVLALTVVGVVMTIGVYGVVAAIVKLDDLGLHLRRRGGTSRLARLRRGVGTGILSAAPWLMKLLSVVGTFAMFLVGGGILVHGIPPLHHLSTGLAARGGLVGGLGPGLLGALVGAVAGGLAVVVVSGGARLLRKWRDRTRGVPGGALADSRVKGGTVALAIEGSAPLLQVFDMPRSIAFYRDVLGFEVAATSGETNGDDVGWALLRHGDAELMLNTMYERGDRPASPAFARVEAHADTCLYLGCRDLDGARKWLREKGLEVGDPVVRAFGMKQLSLSDPDGYGVCLQWREG